MKLALLSDIHGNLPALQAVMADAQTRGATAFANLGDNLSGPLWPRETAEYLMHQSWPQLAGNHERQLLQFDPARHGASDAYAHTRLTPAIIGWLQSLPATCRPTPDILLCHGTPHDDLTYLLETVSAPQTMGLATPGQIRARLGSTAASLIACGHSHVPRVVMLDGSTLVNPGSVGLPAYLGDHPYPHRVENGAPHARYAIASRSGTHWAVELIAVPYEYERSAAKAQQEGRLDWQCALTSGYLH
ncbi:metallophosphatase family protein [Chitiniphilus purpureus]|uniref:Metallophosphatase family protein n=1 Tax=Chitiniphilus purpureus TaxID=2981137 RepID=A0ABY6DLU4_9NEIS|nr:metallophosphatase family protein [Chitiniphilus sp. CD1]UXY15337.1 metallophosphatase family protein [Chitiniphilus sp. CD1]